VGDLRAQPPVPIRVAQEVDDLLDFVLDVVDARDVGERRPRAGLGIVAAGPGPADPAQATPGRRARRCAATTTPAAR
jgi:hypothetical protein